MYEAMVCRKTNVTYAKTFPAQCIGKSDHKYYQHCINKTNLNCLHNTTVNGQNSHSAGILTIVNKVQVLRETHP